MKLVNYLKELFSNHKKLSIFLLITLFICFLLYYYLIQPSLLLYGKSKTLQRDLRPIISALSRHDLETLDFELKYFRTQVVEIRNAANKIGVLSPLPLVGPYAQDLKNTSEAALESYDTIIQMTYFLLPLLPNINFSGWRNDSLINTQTLKVSEVSKLLPSISTELSRYKKNLESISQKLMTIDENRYPEYFRGRPIRKYVTRLRDLSSLVNKYFDDVTEILALVPKIIGTNGPKNYLVIVQNDKEIRPSGGLLGGYAFLSMENGNFKLIKSGDVSFLDKDMTRARLQSPEFITHFLGSGSLYLKDANYSPDFKKSAQTIREIWLSTEKPFDLEGVVVIDTQFLKSLIDTLGEIKLENGESINSGNVESVLDNFFLLIGNQSAESRKYKDLTSILLNELLKKTFAFGTYNTNTLLQKVLKAGAGKHIIIYSTNEVLQSLVEKYKLSGLIKNYNGDYLLVNDAIFSPRRSNWKINQNVTKVTKINGDNLENELKIEFEIQPEIGSPTDTGNIHYVRIYVPKGSKLTSSDGTLEKISESEDLEKTVFAAVIKLEPNVKKILTLNYNSPKPKFDAEQYKLLIQKQPGTGDFKYTIKINDQFQEFNLSEDREIQVK